jgi:DNA primase
MDDTTKYLIHAEVSADGVVERSDVVGAIFGQTEGLLGDELDLRDLQDSSKVGRIDADIESESGRTVGTVTIATSLDKVETATLGAALETITRIGPCRAELEVVDIEDVRTAKRRAVVERAKELLLDSFDDSVMSSEEILTEVREHVRTEAITEYEGLPAGPNVGDSDAVVIVEGRADVLQLLRYGIKNAVAVEGTDVPDAVADLTEGRTVTAFLDADRGGDLILAELAQVGDVDYVAFAPSGESVEDLSHREVFDALREKTAYEGSEVGEARAVAATDGRGAAGEDAAAAEAPSEGADAPATPDSPEPDPEVAVDPPDGTEAAAEPTTETADAADATAEAAASDETGGAADADDDPAAGATAEAPDAELPPTLGDHIAAVDGAGTIRLLDGDLGTLSEGDAAEAFDLLERAETVPETVVLDAELSQRVVDLAAQRGVDRVVAREHGEFTKRPTAVRLLTFSELVA